MLAILFSQLEKRGGVISESGEKGAGLNFDQLFSFLTEDKEEMAKLESSLESLKGSAVKSNGEVDSQVLQEVLQEIKESLKEIKNANQLLSESAGISAGVKEVSDKEVDELSKEKKKDGSEVPQETESKEVTIQIVHELITVWKKELSSAEIGKDHIVQNDGAVQKESSKSTNEILLIKQKLQIHELIKGQVNVSSAAPFDDQKEILGKEGVPPNISLKSAVKGDGDGVLSQVSKELVDNQKKELNKAIDSPSGLSSTIAPDKSLSSNGNPLSVQKEAIHQTIKQEVIQGSASFKMVNPEKIVIQLKPIDLGTVEVTVEKIGGEVHVKLHSDNSDVQNLLDGLADDIRDDLRARDSSATKDQSFEREQNEKRREEPLVAKKDYGQEEENSSFEEHLIDMIGGNSNGYIGYSK